jgi:hypothetical protein
LRAKENLKGCEAMSERVTVNGVPIGEPGPGDDAEPRRLALPSGSIAMVRKAFGRDLMRAQRAAAGGDPTAVVFALIAEVAEVDGRRVVYEDVLAMDLADVIALQSEVIGENFQLPPPRI